MPRPYKREIIVKCESLGLSVGSRDTKTDITERIESFMERASRSHYDDLYNFEEEYKKAWKVWWYRVCCSRSGYVSVPRPECTCERCWNWCGCGNDGGSDEFCASCGVNLERSYRLIMEFIPRYWDMR